MSDDRLREVFEGPGSEADGPKTNARNPNDSRIDDALERMVGMTLIEDGYPVVLPGQTILSSAIPDFKSSENIIEYKEFTRRIAAFKG
jgi:hypothetical protein